MKKSILLLFLFIFVFSSAKAQFSENNAIYYSDGLSIGNYFGVDVNLNYVYREKYSLKIGYIHNWREPKSQPGDYSAGLAKALLFGAADPHDQMRNYQIAVGKIYLLNESRTIRINFSVGLGYTEIKEPANWLKTESAFLAENYTWNYENRNTLSLLINPRIEFPFTTIYGLSLSPMVQINKHRTFFGIGVGQMIGLLRNRNY
ncbi:hypothetical protein [uncultured Draconibacterium sp.]|uniref:hypothetical protein n=1 Tax=uncultured Draconibacterium sp. TaxID=1573823 RepID=UPI0025DF1633|nr:hypothetical protein [uncultured Draconibacterium sp.]